MVKFRWDRIAAEPFDLQALAQRRRSPAKERQIERQGASVKKRKRKRRIVRFWKRMEAEEAQGNGRHAWTICALYRCAELGKWYAAGDLARLAGGHSSPFVTQLRRWRKRGLVLRADNPDWQPAAYRKGVNIRGQEQRRPKWLWSLSELGEREQQGWIAAGRPESVQIIKGKRGRRGAVAVRFTASENENGASRGAVRRAPGGAQDATRALEQEMDHQVAQEGAGDQEAIEMGEEAEH